ncbi:MAG TPA: O-antigen ligase family protein [Bacteroidia bacterium]|jgi:hypothetical protein|nr:O-antigen ligase family protein [Bacteroidia bacterium]
MRLALKKSTVDNVIEYFLVIFLVYANGSWLLFEYPSLVKFGMYCLLLLYLIYDISKTKTISFPNGFIIFLALFPLLSKLINFSKDSDLLNTVSTLIIYAILGFYNKKLLFSLLNKFAQIIYYLCIASIVFGVLFLINYSWLSIFPVHYNALFFGGAEYYNLIIYTDRVINDFRTQSIFWEPGAWVFNEIFALYWFLYIRKDSKVIPVFLVGIALTLSTTGFILIVILGLQIILFSKDKPLRKKFSITFVSIVFVIISLAVVVSAITDFSIGRIFYEQTIDKLLNHSSDAAAESTNGRLGATINAFKIAKDNPIFGIGKQSADSALFVTSSISELCYQLGFLYLLVYVYAFWVTFNKLNLLMSISFVLVMLNGEAYSSYILSSLIVIYGTKNTWFSKTLPVNQLSGNVLVNQ